MKKHNINNLQIIYYEKSRVIAINKYDQTAGYICPFSNEDCMHLDSLSMTKTMICTQCVYFRHEQRVDESLNFSDLNSVYTVNLSTN